MAGQKARSAVLVSNVPAIHVLLWATQVKDVDARHEAGHDGRKSAKIACPVHDPENACPRT